MIAKQMHGTTKVQITTIFLFTCLAFTLICNIASQLPLSPLYQVDLPKLFRKDNERSLLASIYFEQLVQLNWTYPTRLNQEGAPSLHSNRQKEFCIGVLTANRTERYSIQLMHSLMLQLSEDDIKETYIVITHGGRSTKFIISQLRQVPT